MRTITRRRSPVLADYDLILINTSGGKDSQAMQDVIVQRARRANVLDRVVLVHADLGEAEWPDTTDLVREHAAHYGLPLHIVARRTAGGVVETILERVATRGLFPDAARRWCTSDHKRGPIRVLMTALVKQLRTSGVVIGRPVRVLNVLGMRAEESPARSKKEPYRFDRGASNGRRHVDEWRPLHTWTTAQVWARIRRAGTSHHWAYDAGMSRLSCRFCVLASKDDLICSARLNPDYAREHARVEAQVGHRFRKDLSMAQIIETARESTESVPGKATPQLALW